MTYIRFTIPGNPVPKARPRFANGHAFTPEKTRSYEEMVRLFAMKAMRGKKMFTGAVSLSVTAFFPIPQSFTKAVREKAITGRFRHKKKPDWDNVGKIVSDALNGVVYADDAVVSDGAVKKRYSDFPRVEVYVESLEE